MSIRLMTLVWDIDFPTQAQKMIALRLSDYAADSGGSVYPARETIAKACGCDESTVKRTLKAFRECGLLQLVREGGNGPRDTNEWLLNVSLMKALAEGRASLVGGAKGLEIAGDEKVVEAVDSDENKGGTVPPLETVRGASGPVRGAWCPDKGGTSAPQSTMNHHLDSPLARAREGSIYDFGSEAELKAWLHTMASRMHWAIDGPTLDACWREVRRRESGLSKEEFAALKATANTRLTELKARQATGLTDQSRRMTGETP